MNLLFTDDVSRIERDQLHLRFSHPTVIALW